MPYAAILTQVWLYWSCARVARSHSAEGLDPTEYMRRIEQMVDQLLSDSPENTGPMTDDQIKYMLNVGLQKIIKIMFNRRSRYESFL